MRNTRGKLFIVMILAALSLLVYLTLPGGKVERENEGAAYFTRSLGQLAQPPGYALERGMQDGTVRWLDRIKWGPSRPANLAMEFLCRQGGDGLTGRIFNRIESLRDTEPSTAARYIDLLAEIEAPESLPLLIDYTDSPSLLIRDSALRGVARFEGPEAARCLIRRSGSPDERTASLSLELLVQNQEPMVKEFFLAKLSDSDPVFLPKAIQAVSGWGDPSMAFKIRPFLYHDDYAVRTTALRGLLVLGDSAAFDKIAEILARGGPVLKKTAVASLNQATVLPPFEVLEPLARDEDPSIRLAFAGMLAGRADREQGDSKGVLLKLLSLLEADSRPEVRLKAVEGRYRAGAEEEAAPFLDAIRTAYGGALRESVAMTADILQIDQAGRLMENRYLSDPTLTVEDRTILIDGLAALQYRDSSELFFRTIAGEWASESPGSDSIKLDHYAALKVHLLGDVLSSWLSLINPHRSSDRLVGLFLNSVRFLEDARASQAIFTIAEDPQRPLWLRKEAIVTAGFIPEPAVGRMLLEFAQGHRQSALADLAEKIFWNIF